MKNLNNKQIININMGLLGIQFAWTLVIANTSGIFSFLGAEPNQLSSYWLLPSIIALLLPPVIGYLSDRTTSRFGKRLPYIFAGAVIAAIVMLIFPNSKSVMTAVIMLSLFSAAFNMALQPFRALVTDVAPANLHTKVYAVQAALIGTGAILASIFPWTLAHFHNESWSSTGIVPLEVIYAFYIGAVIILASNIWSSLTGKNYIAAEAPITSQTKPRCFSFSLKQFPKIMRQVCLIQILTWLGTFCFIIYLTPTIERTIFHISPIAQITHNALYRSILEQSTILTGLLSGLYMLTSVIFAYLIPVIAQKFERCPSGERV